MTLKKIGIILFLISTSFFFVLPIYKIYAQTSNAGFVPGNIWYSVDPFKEGDKIKIYTLIFNPDTRELSGTVIFFDNSIFLGKKDFIAPGKEVKDVSIDWTVMVGDHKIFAKIENAKFLLSNGKYEEVYLAENKTQESVRTVTKIIPKAIDSDVNHRSEIVPGLESIRNIEKIIGENTPEFIAKPIILTATAIEKWRSDTAIVSKNKKETAQSQIKALDFTKNNDEKTVPDSKNVEVNKTLKPFKYIEFFFFTFLSFVFNNKFIFYGALMTVIFLFLRWIWHLIF